MNIPEERGAQIIYGMELRNMLRTILQSPKTYGSRNDGESIMYCNCSDKTPIAVCSCDSGYMCNCRVERLIEMIDNFSIDKPKDVG